MSDAGELPARCEQLLRTHFPRLRVVASDVLKEWERSRVLRLELEAGPSSSLIVKQVLSSPDLGFTDYASHAFLSSLDTPLAARFVIGDATLRFFLMEDLGALHNLSELLPQNDELAIQRALERLGSTMARLANATIGREQDWNRIRASLPAGPGPNRHTEARTWRQGWRKVQRWLQQIDVPMPKGLDTVLAELEANYVAPSHLAFSQGDPAPTNHTLTHERCRLVDFEYGAFRHALHDLAQWHIRCPLKAHWFDGLCAPMKEHLVGPMFVDEESFSLGLALQAAYSAIYMYMWIPVEQALERDFARVGSWTQRDALICTSRRLATLAGELEMLEPARVLARSILQRLETLWPEHGDGEITWQR